MAILDIYEVCKGFIELYMQIKCKIYKIQNKLNCAILSKPNNLGAYVYAYLP